MIIPIRCMTCGNVIANKYKYYLRSVQQKKRALGMNNSQVLYLTEEFKNKTPEGEVLDELKMNLMCCRRHFLTHVDIE